MIESIGGLTSELVGVALDAALLRHATIANNIANANTPEFAPSRVRFEEYFAGHVWGFDAAADASLASHLETARNALDDGTLVTRNPGDTVELDMQMVELTMNTLRYQALLTAAGKLGEIAAMAVREGRR